MPKKINNYCRNDVQIKIKLKNLILNKARFMKLLSEGGGGEGRGLLIVIFSPVLLRSIFGRVVVGAMGIWLRFCLKITHNTPSPSPSKKCAYSPSQLRKD